MNVIYVIVKTPTQLQRNLNPTIVGGWTPTPPHPTQPTPQKLNVRNISAVTAPILAKL